MAITPKTIEDLMNDIATELVNPTDPNAESADIDDWNSGSKIKIQSRGFARIVADCWRALVEVQRDSNPATAIGQPLDLLTNLFGVYRKLGAQAAGFAVAIPKSLSAPAIAVTPGELFTLAGTTTFIATGSATLGSPYAVFPIQCTVIGSQYNLSAGTQLTPSRSIISAAYNVYVGSALDARGNPTGGLGDGEDVELDDPLRARFGDALLSFVRGTYKAVYTAIATLPWIRSFSLVRYVPMIGYMTAFIDDGSSNTTLDPTNKAELLTLVDEWICGGIGFRAQVMGKVLAPIVLDVTVDKTFAVATVEAQVQAHIETLLNGWGLGQQLYTSRVEAMAFDIPGVTASLVTAPAGELLPVLPQQVFRPSSVTINAHV